MAAFDGPPDATVPPFADPAQLQVRRNGPKIPPAAIDRMSTDRRLGRVEANRRPAGGRWADAEYLHARALDDRQFARIDEYRLSPGGRRVRMTAADSFDVELLPDRGLDLGSVSYQGIPLAFITPAVLASPPPDEAGSFARRFGAGLLTTCGLDHFGPAIRDANEELPQHGRASELAATEVRAETCWRNGSFCLAVSGRMRQWRLFGEDLVWNRTVSTALGSDTLTIADTVTNAGAEPWPHMMLYHCNIGHPVLDEGTTIDVPPAGAATAGVALADPTAPRRRGGSRTRRLGPLPPAAARVRRAGVPAYSRCGRRAGRDRRGQ